MFSVPLSDDTHALGVVARKDRRGNVLFAYFFGPRRQGEPEGVPDADLRPGDAALATRVFPGGFDDGSWQPLGKLPGWDREAWRMPDLIRGPDGDGGYWRERYADDNPDRLIGSDPASDEDVETLPSEGVRGDRSLVIVLDDQLQDVRS